ncbi:MAG: hypothetical protein L6R40_008322 [Gallowayella cf. fulva]|nr:MAG: hypothetical protein L6R40_008322 [Xanthomendoza cf. fulva]
MKPAVQEVNALLHLTYNLPGRVHTAKFYPLPASNGSTVLFLGHEHGLQLLWRGGRTPRDHKRQQNDHNYPDQSNLLDSDYGTDVLTSHGQNPCLESDEEDYDPSIPVEPIVQSLDLPFGVGVHHIAFPHLSTDASEREHGAFPSLYSEKLVAAVVCSDASVRLVLLPNSPPSPLRKKEAMASSKPCIADGRVGPHGERIILLTSGNDHQVVPDCIALTSVPSSARGDSYLEMNVDDTQSARDVSADPRQQYSRTRSESSSERRAGGWDLLVASSSSSLSGFLLIHRIPLTADGTTPNPMTADHTSPWNIQHLPSPTASIDFSPSLPRDGRNAMLLIAEVKGPVRVFDCLTTETARQRTWLISLMPGFQAPIHGRAGRKHVLCAKWVQGGKAILVLLARGEWGIWDLRDSPTETSSRIRAPQAITIGSFSTFAISGSVIAGPRLISTDARDTKSRDGGKAGKLAPTTPGTRRVRQDNLFSGPVQQCAGPARGGISVASSQGAETDDEVVLLWYNDSITVIPSLRTHCKHKVKGSGNLFGNGAKGEARTTSSVSLRGERQNEVSLLPAGHQSIDRGSPDDNNFLVLGETRFVIVATAFGEPPTTQSNPMKPASDQKVLERGDLTLEGMESVLGSMTNRLPTNDVASNKVPSKRKVNLVGV